MGLDQEERCTLHLDLEPIEIVSVVIRSAQSDYPTAHRTAWVCPVCR